MTRHEQDTDALEQLNWLRVHQPKVYDQIMLALAQLVAAARQGWPASGKRAR